MLDVGSLTCILLSSRVALVHFLSGPDELMWFSFGTLTLQGKYLFCSLQNYREVMSFSQFNHISMVYTFIHFAHRYFMVRSEPLSVPYTTLIQT